MKRAGAVEFELRFQAPAYGLAGPRTRSGTARSESLARRHRHRRRPPPPPPTHVLRLRREGDRWVQALKSRGDGPAARPEQVVLGGRRAPADRPARHAGTPRATGGRPAGRRRAAAGAPAHAGAATDAMMVRRGGAVKLELVWDRGHLHAGGRSLAVAEVESSNGVPARRACWRWPNAG